MFAVAVIDGAEVVEVDGVVAELDAAISPWLGIACAFTAHPVMVSGMRTITIVAAATAVRFIGDTAEECL
ncbi:MAG: hypothetical protein NVSMB1_24660 [Polyangiales bacterium]